MNRFKKIALIVSALGALAAGGSTVAAATGLDGGHDDGDELVTGREADRAGRAALGALKGGSVREVERQDDGASGYEVKVDRAGRVYEVQVSDAYTVTGQELDDDQGRDERDDGDRDED